MLLKKIKFILTLSTILLLSIVSVAQAAPPLQEGAQEENASLGETLDLDEEEDAGRGYNLGTVMSGANGDTDGDAGDGTDDGTDGDTNGDTDDSDGIDDGTMQHPVASALASFFEVDYEEVFSLHEEGYGFGEIAFAYFFADMTGMSEEELLQAAHESGWGNVLKENGIHPGSIGGRVKSWPENRNGDDVEEETELEGSEDAGPPEHAGPPAGVGGRPDHAGPPAGVSPGNFAGPGGGGEDGSNGRAGDGNGGGNGAVGRPSDAGGPGGSAGNGGGGNQGGRGGGRP